MKEVLGPWTDIPAPDIGTDERVMAWIFDEFSKHKGFSPAVTTGKVRHWDLDVGQLPIFLSFPLCYTHVCMPACMRPVHNSTIVLQ